MLNSKISSAVKKAGTLISDGVDPYIAGKNNFELVNIEAEQIAKERAKLCGGCRYFKKEPIKDFQVVDVRIPELSEMMCGRCGCTLSYKTRQSIQVCAKWLKK